MELLFLLAQMLLVVMFSHYYITSLSGLARISISHIIASNIFFWLLSLAKESEESLRTNDEYSRLQPTGECSRHSYLYQQESESAVTRIEERMSFLLFTFATCFILYCTSLLYKMWTNCGKKTSSIRRKLAETYDSWAPQTTKSWLFKCNFKICEVICGFGVGSLALFSSLGTIAVDNFLRSGSSVVKITLFYHMAVSIIWLAVLIFMLPLATCIIKGHPKRSRGVFNWMTQPVLAVTSVASLAYAVFNSMSALLQLFNGDKLNLDTPQQSNGGVEVIAAFIFLLNVLRSVEIVLQSIYLTDAMQRQVSTAGDNDVGNQGDISSDEEDELSWADRSSSSRVFVVLFLFVNLALMISEIYEITHSSVMNADQVGFYGVLNWCLFSHFVGVFVCLYRLHSVVCLLDVLRVAF